MKNFESKLKNLKNKTSIKDSQFKRVQSLITKWAKKNPSKKEEYFTRAKKWAGKWLDKIDDLEKELAEIAQETKIPKSKDFIFFKCCDPYIWSGQGYGANKYAKNYAEKEKSKAEHFGLEAEIRKESSKYNKDHILFNVYVKTSEIGLEILKRKYQNFAEVIRGYYLRSANPRVDYPFLNYGFEEMIGIDFFGKIVDKEKWEKALKNFS